MSGNRQLIVMGAGSERAPLEELARRREVVDRISFEEFVPSLCMPDFYQKLDAFVLPSRSRPNWVEQFGRVLIEAMACGVPVVGSNCGEIPNVIGDAGLVFPEDDVDALRQHLMLLMNDPGLRTDLIRRGRERVLGQFTQAQIAAQTVKVYREMIDDEYQ
jgi:glycosyltransferase involved in cell wall biosynthesis